MQNSIEQPTVTRKIGKAHLKTLKIKQKLKLSITLHNIFWHNFLSFPLLQKLLFHCRVCSLPLKFLDAQLKDHLFLKSSPFCCFNLSLPNLVRKCGQTHKHTQLSQSPYPWSNRGAACVNGQKWTLSIKCVSSGLNYKRKLTDMQQNIESFTNLIGCKGITKWPAICPDSLTSNLFILHNSKSYETDHPSLQTRLESVSKQRPLQGGPKTGHWAVVNLKVHINPNLTLP